MRSPFFSPSSLCALLLLIALTGGAGAAARANDDSRELAWMIECTERLERLGLVGSEARIGVVRTTTDDGPDSSRPSPLAFRTPQGFFLFTRERIAGYRVAPAPASSGDRAPASVRSPRESSTAFAQFGAGPSRAFYRVPEPSGMTGAWRSVAPAAGPVLAPDPELTARGPVVLATHLRRLVHSLPESQARAAEALLRDAYTETETGVDHVPNPMRPEKMIASASASAFQDQLIRLVSTVNGTTEPEGPAPAEFSATSAAQAKPAPEGDPEEFRRVAKACLARRGGPAALRRDVERSLASLPL